jgi:amino acid adenylation domain-containing protein
MNKTAEDAGSFKVLVNDEGQYSIWSSGKNTPPGWHCTDMFGTKGVCLEYIANAWSDMIPLSVRSTMRTGRNPTILCQDQQCVHQLFERQAAKTPDEVVMTCEDRTLTYDELNRGANQLGHYLQRQGIGPEEIVGVVMERSLEAVIVLYGILKTGGAYVAIDPHYPESRIMDIIMQTGISLIIARKEHASMMDAAGIEVIDYDAAPSLLQKESVCNILSGVTLDNLAYVTFTSGTGGKPKGIMGTHRSIVNGFAHAYFERDREGETCCLMAPLSFAASVFTMLLPPCWQIPVVVIPEGLEREPWYVAQAIAKHRVTSMVMVPSLFRQLIGLGVEGGRCLQSVRTLALSGSAVTTDLIAAFRNILPNAKMTVSYSSSEAGGVVTAEMMPAQSLSEKVAIGRVVPNTRLYILDDDMNPVEPDDAGEVYIASPHLSRGYAGRPALTAEFFLPNPFTQIPGERFFRTGDRARFHPDGRVELLGRCDNLVKIRGFRVELEEIGSAISMCPDVKEATVVTRMFGQEQRLVAYLVTGGGTDMNVTRIRRHLSLRLPEYMIPSTFVFLDRFPLNSHGKLDYRALPEPDGQRPPLDFPCEHPVGPIETALCNIWKNLLGLDQIGIHDDFLDLGGDSIIAAQAVMRIKELYRVEIPIPLFFECPTVVELANEISRSCELPCQPDVIGSERLH